MLAILPILISISAAVIMVVLRRFQPKFTQFWLLTLLSALVVWILVLVSRIQEPHSISLINWQPGDLFPISPILQVDHTSWVFSFSVATLLLATILTDSTGIMGAKESASRWADWAILLAISALSMLAILAGNLLLLTFAWFALDTLEFAVWIAPASDDSNARRAVSNYAYRIATIFMILVAWMITTISGNSYVLGEVSQGASLFLLFATCIRLWLLADRQNIPHPNGHQSAHSGMLVLIPTASSLLVISRIANVGFPDLFNYPLLMLTFLVGLTGSWSWYRAKDELYGGRHWIIGMSVLVIASAVGMQPQASQVWGAGLLLPGGMLLLYSVRRRWLLLFLLLALIGLAALPFTLTWSGALMYAGSHGPLINAFLVVQALLLAGFFLHAVRPGDRFPTIERWAWIIYPTGIVVILLSYVLTGLFGFPGPGFPNLGRSAITTAWPSIAAVVLAAFFIGLKRRDLHISFKIHPQLSHFVSLKWTKAMRQGLIALIQQSINFTNRLLEGRGGLLWTLLLLTLLISFLAQINLGR